MPALQLLLTRRKERKIIKYSLLSKKEKCTAHTTYPSVPAYACVAGLQKGGGRGQQEARGASSPFPLPSERHPRRLPLPLRQYWPTENPNKSNMQANLQWRMTVNTPLFIDQLKKVSSHCRLNQRLSFTRACGSGTLLVFMVISRTTNMSTYCWSFAAVR